MYNLSKEIKIGLVVVVSFIILIFGTKYLKGLEVFSKSTNYFVVYDHVEGLNEGSPIIFRGFKVGSVRKITLHPTRTNKILVTCLITENVVLATDTKAEITSLDLLGAKGINLLEGRNPNLLMPDDTLSQAYEQTLKQQFETEIAPIKAKFDVVLLRLDTLLKYTNELMSPNNSQGLTMGLADFNVSMRNLKGISNTINSELSIGGSLNNSFKNFDTISSTLSSKSSSLNRIISNLDTTTTQLKNANLEKTIKYLNDVLVKATSILDSVNQGAGTAGMLLNDKTLYYSLLSSANNLDRLLIDVKQNPKRYINVSAIDWSKNVYLSPSGDGTIANDEMPDFSVQLNKASLPLDLKSKEVHGYVVEEMVYKSNYLYLLGKSKSFLETKKIFELVKNEYPNAEIVAFKKGDSISLKKAMKIAVN